MAEANRTSATTVPESFLRLCAARAVYRWSYPEEKSLADPDVSKVVRDLEAQDPDELDKLKKHIEEAKLAATRTLNSEFERAVEALAIRSEQLYQESSEADRRHLAEKYGEWDPRDTAQDNYIALDEVPDVQAAYYELVGARQEQPSAIRGAIESYEKAAQVYVQDSVSLYINQSILGESFTPEWRLPALLGLARSVIDPQYVPAKVSTEFTQVAERIVRALDGGSVGIAGPRGAGKSTVIRMLAESDPGQRPTVPRAGSIPNTTPNPPYSSRQVTVIEPAPVKFEAREFVLHLFARTCEEYLGRKLRNSDDFESDTLRYVPSGRFLANLGRAVWIAALPIAMSVIAATQLNTQRSWLILIMASVILLVRQIAWSRAVSVPGSRLFEWLRPAFGVLFLSLALEANVVGAMGQTVPMAVGFLGLAWAPLTQPGPVRQYDRMVHNLSTRVSLAVFCVASVGLGLASAAQSRAGGTDLAPWTLASAPMTTADYWSVFVLVAAVLVPSPLFVEAALPQEEIDLVEQRSAVLATLRSVQYQQALAYSAENNVSLKPKVLEISSKSNVEETWTALPLGYAEILGRYRALLTDLTTYRDVTSVIIAIDELDKLSTTDVEPFLNALKGVFGVPGVTYLTTISLDAAWSFERRGAPLREVFDSCFDEVVVLRELAFGDAKTLLNSRVIGMPSVFKALVFVLSGGLARDVIRLVRRMTRDVERGKVLEIRRASADLVQQELRARWEGLARGGTLTPGALQVEAALERLGEACEAMTMESLMDAERSLLSSLPACAEDHAVADAVRRLAAAAAVSRTVIGAFALDDEGQVERLVDDGQTVADLAWCVREVNRSPESVRAKVASLSS